MVNSLPSVSSKRGKKACLSALHSLINSVTGYTLNDPVRSRIIPPREMTQSRFSEFINWTLGNLFSARRGSFAEPTCPGRMRPRWLARWPWQLLGEFYVTECHPRRAFTGYMRGYGRFHGGRFYILLPWRTILNGKTLLPSPPNSCAYAVKATRDPTEQTLA